MKRATNVAMTVFRYLEGGDATALEITTGTGLSRIQVHNALSYLRRRGDIGKGDHCAWYSFLDRALVQELERPMRALRTRPKGRPRDRVVDEVWDLEPGHGFSPLRGQSHFLTSLYYRARSLDLPRKFVLRRANDLYGRKGETRHFTIWRLN